MRAFRAGEEIQSLSRFVGAQRLAFHKLLKKYRKWTGSADLGKRFRETVLNRPTSFSKRDFEGLLTQWTEVLASVRAPFEEASQANFGAGEARKGKLDWQVNDRSIPVAPQDRSSHRPYKAKSSAARMHSTWETGSNIDADTAFAVLPLGNRARKAVYWVHPDDIVQIRVFLLQYTRVQKLNGLEHSAGKAPSSGSSSRGSIRSQGCKSLARPDEEIGLVLCDDLGRFAKQQNGETISDLEHRLGAVTEKAAATIRYAKNREAVIVVHTVPESGDPCRHAMNDEGPRQITLERKLIPWLFSCSKSEQSIGENSRKEIDKLSKWLEIHTEVQPLLQLSSRRTRLAGLKNCENSGIWATLDRDVMMRSCSREFLTSGKALAMTNENEENKMISFPYAVLEVRIEGDANTDLIAKLDSSHLVGMHL